jgi:hypothetical protein
MSDAATIATAVFSAIATGFAAFATWQAPRAAARLSEQLRRASEHAQERQKSKQQIFGMLMQERAAIYTEDGVKALNLIDVVFHDNREVREAWAELFLIFNTNPLPPHVLEERLRKLLSAIAKDVGLGESLRTDDLGRVYSPNAITQDRMIKDMQRQQVLASLQGRSSPAANVASSEGNIWPPKPD